MVDGARPLVEFVVLHGSCSLQVINRLHAFFPGALEHGSDQFRTIVIWAAGDRTGISPEFLRRFQ